MIITCPACATRYVVPDTAIGGDGRKVKCAKCQQNWFQEGPKLEDLAKSEPQPAPAPVAPTPAPSATPATSQPEPRQENAPVPGFGTIGDEYSKPTPPKPTLAQDAAPPPHYTAPTPTAYAPPPEAEPEPAPVQEPTALPSSFNNFEQPLPSQNRQEPVDMADGPSGEDDAPPQPMATSGSSLRARFVRKEGVKATQAQPAPANSSQQFPFADSPATAAPAAEAPPAASAPQAKKKKKPKKKKSFFAFLSKKPASKAPPAASERSPEQAPERVAPRAPSGESGPKAEKRPSFFSKLFSKKPKSESAPLIRGRRNPIRIWTAAAVMFAVIVLFIIVAASYFGLPSWVPVSRSVFGPENKDLVLNFPAEKQDRRMLPNGSEFFGASGTVTNVGQETVDVPSIMIVMRDEHERTVYSWEVLPTKDTLAPGEKMIVREAVTNVPKSAKYAEIGWKAER